VSTAKDRIKNLIEDLTSDPAEERVVEYVVREIEKGRSLMEVIEDPYVRNRLNEKKRARLLENPEILDSVESEIREAFSTGTGESS
jgi:hypothetical protein